MCHKARSCKFINAEKTQWHVIAITLATPVVPDVGIIDIYIPYHGAKMCSTCHYNALMLGRGFLQCHVQLGKTAEKVVLLPIQNGFQYLLIRIHHR